MKSDNQKTARAQDGFAIEVTVSERVTVGVQMDSPLTDEEVWRRIIFSPALLCAPLAYLRFGVISHGAVEALAESPGEE